MDMEQALKDAGVLEGVPKESLKVEIQTTHGRFLGSVHVRRDRRLLDELNQLPPFLAVTEVRQAGVNGSEPLPFIALNKSRIVWIQPLP